MDCLSPQSISGAMCGNSVSNFLAFIHFQQRPIDLLKRKSICVLADAIFSGTNLDLFSWNFSAGTYFSSIWPFRFNFECHKLTITLPLEKVFASGDSLLASIRFLFAGSGSATFSLSDSRTFSFSSPSSGTVSYTHLTLPTKRIV